MARSPSWYESSWSWIQQQCQAHPELSREELRKHCSRNYPYDMRRGWAYRSFLRAMHDHFGRDKAAQCPDQVDLFDT